MTITRPVMPDTEPTEEFEGRCQSILRQWQTGELPFQQAAEQLEAMRIEAIEQEHLANQGRVETLFGVMQGYRSNLSTALQHFERSHDLFTKLGNQRRMLTCELNMGEINRQRGNFTEARRLFDTSFELAAKLGDSRAQSIVCANTGQMLLSMRQYDSAQQFLEDSIALSTDWPEDRIQQLPAMLCEVHHGLAQIHLVKGEHAAALEQAQAAVRDAQVAKQPMSIGFANRIMAETLAVLGDAAAISLGEDASTDPSEYFRASIRAFEEIGAEGEMARTMHAHARWMAGQGRRVPAARLLQQATLIFAKLRMADDAAKAAESQAEIF